MKKKYFFGEPKSSSYNIILDQFSGTKINSIKTSSIPLLEFWKDTDKRLNIIESVSNLKLKNSKLIFEYSTPSYKSNKSSMTDLMILDDNKKIAIEAKYTEYLKGKYETVESWFDKSENRKNVLIHWLSIIKDFTNCTKISDIKEIPYQFLHRVASACYQNESNAYVIYQIFYDLEYKSKFEDYVILIKEAVRLLKAKTNLNIYIWGVETYLHNKDVKDPFQYMKKNFLYSFRNEKLVCISNDI